MSLIDSFSRPSARPFMPPWVVGNRYDTTSFYGGGATGLALAANVMYGALIVPIGTRPGQAMGLTALDFRITTSGAVGKKARCALYNANYLPGGDWYPTSLIAQSVEKPTDPGSNVTEDDTTFTATVYDLVPIWAFIWGDGAPSIAGVGNGGSKSGITTSAQGGSVYPGIQLASQTYTAGSSSFPSTFTAGAVSSTIAPIITLKRGS